MAQEALEVGRVDLDPGALDGDLVERGPQRPGAAGVCASLRAVAHGVDARPAAAPAPACGESGLGPPSPRAHLILRAALQPRELDDGALDARDVDGLLGLRGSRHG